MVTRRDFLKTMSMASAGLALGAGDLLHAQTISPKKGRGDKVKIAYIGIGNRGEQIIEDFARTGMVEVVALCDVDMGAKHTQKIMAKYPKVPKSPSNHFENFLLACNGIEKTRSPFEINGVLSQVFSLGVMAQRLNTQLFFDSRTKQITNNEFANAMLAGLPPRKGWDEFYKL